MSAYPEQRLPDDEAIDSTAAEWLVERDAGFTRARAAAFAAWRHADSRHEAAVVRTEAALGLLAEMPAVRPALEARLTAAAVSTHPAWFRPALWAASLAAAVILALAGAWLVRSRTEVPLRFTSAANHQEKVALIDGSVVNLNVSTAMQVALSANERRVTLTAGEAHFAVAHDTARPFIVTAGDVAIRAVGTAFSVGLGDHGVEVLVTEGKVEVTRVPAGTPPAPALPAEHPLLVAGERTLIRPDATAGGTGVERISTDALQTAVRWHSPIMTFTDLPLRDAVELFNRRNVQQVTLADPSLGERKIGGAFAADQVEAFVRLLVHDGDIHMERRSASEIALHRAP
jgi:transmembrane sensor